MTNEQLNKVVLHLLIANQAEINVLKDFMVRYIAFQQDLNIEDTMRKLKELSNQQKDLIAAQLKAHYETDFDVDDFLNDIFS